MKNELLLGILIMSWEEVPDLLKMTKREYTIKAIDADYASEFFDTQSDRYKSKCPEYDVVKPHIKVINIRVKGKSPCPAYDSALYTMSLDMYAKEQLTNGTPLCIVDPDLEYLNLEEYEFNMGDDIFAYDVPTGTWFHLEYFD